VTQGDVADDGAVTGARRFQGSPLARSVDPLQGKEDFYFFTHKRERDEGGGKERKSRKRRVISDFESTKGGANRWWLPKKHFCELTTTHCEWKK